MKLAMKNAEQRTRKKPLQELVINVTNNCNLKCKHCDSIHLLCKKKFSLERIKNIIDEAVELGVGYVVIMGGEPLMEIERLGEILNYLEKKKVQFGVVTNGLLVEDNLEFLKKYKFFYFDVSIDGIKKDHEKTRGEETFEKSINGLKLAIENKLSERIFVSTTLMSYNYKNIPEMINELSKLGINGFSLGVYVYCEGVNPKEWILTKEQLLELINDLKREKFSVGQILIDIHTQVKDYWDWLIEKGVIGKKGVKRDSKGNVFFQIPETKIILRNSYLTHQEGVGIITSDGYYLDDYRFIGRNYKSNSLGNIKEKSLKEILS